MQKPSQKTLGILRDCLEQWQPRSANPRLTAVTNRFWQDTLFDAGFQPKFINIASRYDFRWNRIIPDLFTGNFSDHNSYFSTPLAPSDSMEALLRLLEFALDAKNDMPCATDLHESLIKDGIEIVRGSKADSSVSRELAKKPGVHPDGLHCDAQICLKGHVQQCEGAPFDSKAHCTKCGASCIEVCQHCKEPIRGGEIHRPVDTYQLPQYCHGCGRPYPWMEDRLETARELLRQDEKLTIADREELFDVLRDVMSDPKSPLTPAKRKLIDIKLEKTPGWIRDLVLDLVAKTTAEVMKG